MCEYCLNNVCHQYMSKWYKCRARLWFEVWWKQWRAIPIKSHLLLSSGSVLIRRPDWGLLKGFLANNKSQCDTSAGMLCDYRLQESGLSCIHEGLSTERAFNCFWKFIIVWLLCCEIVVSLIMAKWNLELQIVCCFVYSGKVQGKVHLVVFGPAQFIFHINIQHPAGGKLISGFDR